MDHNLVFIHHGHDRFDPELFTPVKNEMWKGVIAFDKPIGGFWATVFNPDGKDEWEKYLLNELEDLSDDEDVTTTHPIDPSFTFTLKPDSRIYVVNIAEDVFALPGRYRFNQDSLTEQEHEFMEKYVFNFYKQYYIDFEQMVKDGYDGILVYMSPPMRYVLYAWDVTSLLIFNPDIIQM